MTLPDRRFDAIESQATAWLVRRDGGLSAGEKTEFDRWCAADPRHAVAVNEIAAVWSAFDRPTASGQIEPLRAELHALDRRKRHRWMASGAATTLAAACLAVFFDLQHPPTPKPVALGAATTTAREIEPERRTLPDGSIVELKRGANIIVAFNDESRVVILQHGEAHFSVAKDPMKPFTVETGAFKICAVGTAFAVDSGQAAVEVLVTEGRVSIASLSSAPPHPSGARRVNPQGASVDASPSIVEAGQRAVVLVGSAVSLLTVVPIPVAELTERLSWRLPRLEFSETSVADAIAMFNRHNPRQLYTADRAVAAMRITGVFRSDSVEGFVRALESSLGIQVERRGRVILLRSAQ